MVKLHVGVLELGHGRNRWRRHACAGENWRAGRAAFGMIFALISKQESMGPGGHSRNRTMALQALVVSLLLGSLELDPQILSELEASDRSR